jgi:hypothetical protein
VIQAKVLSFRFVPPRPGAAVKAAALAERA